MSIRVLVVDDLPFMRELIGGILIESGLEQVGEAGNGVEGVQEYRRLKPDVVLMDVAMPEMNGIQALAEIKREDPAACVVMCSALDEEPLIIRAIQLGASDFVVKPFHSERIINAVKRAALRNNKN